jgi:hypothetical protein
MRAAHLLTERYRDQAELEILRRRFEGDDYVHLPGLLAADARAELDACAEALRRRSDALSALNFTMPGCGTPRRMFTLGWSGLRLNAPELAAVYELPELRALAGALAPDARQAEHEHERMVANFQVEHGHTHGWHLDDPPYAMVLILRAPAPAEGGLLEFVRDWPVPSASLRERPLWPSVAAARDEGRVCKRHHAAGDGYLMRADRCLHRVTPLVTGDGERVVLNLAFEGAGPTVYRGTSDILHAGEPTGKWPIR